MKTPNINFVVGEFYKIIKLPLTSYIEGLEDFPILYIGYSLNDVLFDGTYMKTIHCFYSLNKNKFYYIDENDVRMQHVFIEELF